MLLKSHYYRFENAPYMSVFKKKQYPENFVFLILRVLELFAREVCEFL